MEKYKSIEVIITGWKSDIIPPSSEKINMDFPISVNKSGVGFDYNGKINFFRIIYAGKFNSILKLNADFVDYTVNFVEHSQEEIRDWVYKFCEENWEYTESFADWFDLSTQLTDQFVHESDEFNENNEELINPLLFEKYAMQWSKEWIEKENATDIIEIVDKFISNPERLKQELKNYIQSILQR